MKYPTANGQPNDEFTTRIGRAGSPHDPKIMTLIAINILALSVILVALRGTSFSMGLAVILLPITAAGVWRGSRYLRWYRFGGVLTLATAVLGQGGPIEVGGLGLRVFEIMTLCLTIPNLLFILSAAWRARNEIKALKCNYDY